MRVVLQNNSTSLYLGNGDQWMPGFRDAHDFQSLQNLVEFSRKEKLEDVQVGEEPRRPVLPVSDSEAIGRDESRFVKVRGLNAALAC